MVKFINLQRNVKHYDGKPGFVHNDFIITDCYLDETGRFPVNPTKYYGLTYTQVRQMKGRKALKHVGWITYFRWLVFNLYWCSYVSYNTLVRGKRGKKNIREIIKI